VIRPVAIIVWVAALGGLACRQSARDRAAAEVVRAREGAQVAQTDVVRASASPVAPGRMIYDQPTDLSYASARTTRPDLVRPGATER
jgi:hypothetical protein